MHNDSLASLVPVIPGQIGGTATHIISARSLHKALGVGRDFTNWIKSRINEYGFIEGVDYIVVENLSSPNPASAKSRQQVAHDYHLTTNTGKETAMVERSEQGRAIRQYLIHCEEELRRAAPLKAAELREQMKARIEAAGYFKPMCEALALARAAEGKTTEPRHYANESNMVARIVLGGLTASQWAKSAGITGEPRNHMTPEQLAHFAYLERSNITLIETGQTYQQRKAELIRLSQRWLTRLTGGDHA
ncbi:antA/AntB antirepressor family protein [Salmonella enterica]|nr:antA/AntB antirepressor family protein [Salmonella enterica]EKJ0768112.1 antA/AntB antirepressor family protein [Salmonella enterica]